MELSVCRAVLQVFEGLPKNGKPQEARGEFTVLAGIAAVNGSSDVNVLSVATGTKCCGQVSLIFRDGIRMLFFYHNLYY